MTDPNVKASVPALVGSVNRLTEWVEDNAAATHRLADRLRKHRLWLVLTIVGLLLDLCLSGLFLYQHAQQACTNNNLKARQTVQDRSFRAERDKVAGQVAGLVELRNAGRDRARAMAGFDQFIAASKHYLVVIGEIHDYQAKHPLGAC